MADKELFIRRIYAFINQKSFTPRQNIAVTPHMQVLISASAVQVTFGLEVWDLSYFSNILVYPGEYINPKTGLYHKGETNLGGFMCFSWKDFVKGNADPEDKINLGLHEFAHALRFNGIKGSETDYFFENYFPRWIACASKEFNRMKTRPGILRAYGAVNINEFFSVVIETFFERPQEFRQHLPELYHQTSILLNQTFRTDGSVYLNCRAELMGTINTTLTQNYNSAIQYNLRYNTSIIMAAGFALVGLFSMRNGGYSYPSPYICFLIAFGCWLYLEKNYTRLFFETNLFRVQKGFFLLKGYRNLRLPLSHLISMTAYYEYKTADNGSSLKHLTSIQIIYYYNGSFYEDELNAAVDDDAFEELCWELRKNNIHVFVKD